MNESQCLAKMVAPGTPRPNKPYYHGVIQICVTSSCDKSCYACTQASNVSRPLWVMTPDQFSAAVDSLQGYFGVIGVFGGNPALSRHFREYCRILRESWVPFERRGVWCNNPISADNAKEMRLTFSPIVSNLNVHLDSDAYDLMKQHWPESHPVGLREDSRHSPPWVAMRDVLRKECPGCDGDGKLSSQWAKEEWLRKGGGHKEPGGPGYKWVYWTEDGKEIGFKTIGGPCGTCNGSGEVYDESRGWELISNCDINQRWSAMIGVFRGQLRAWFCEVAGAQAMLHQDEPDYPDTGLDPVHLYNERIWTGDMSPGRELPWWQLPMTAFTRQVRKHCHDCGVPLRGYGELAQADDKYGKEQVSATHAGVYRPKRTGRTVEVVTDLVQLGVGKIQVATNYIQNSAK